MANRWNASEMIQVVVALGIALLSGCRTAPQTALTRFEYTQPEMGLPFRIVLYAPNQASADAAARAAFARIRELNGILSDYDDESELSRLSRSSGQGKKVPVSGDLWTVLAAAETMSRRSGGAFDVTVGPLVDLWKKARRERKLPDPERLVEARQRV